MTVRRVVLPLLIIAGALLVASGFDGVRHIAYADGSATVLDAGAAAGSGSATTTPTVPDPLGHPGDTLSTLGKLYHSGAWLSLAILAAFCLLVVLDKKIGWFEANSKRAAYVAAALGALALLAAPAAQGTTPNLQMIIAALGTAIALAVNPVKKAA